MTWETGIIGALTLLAVAVAGEAPPTDGEDTDGGTILMFRTRAIMGAAVACPIRIEGIEVVELGRGKYFEMPVEPGRHILTNKTSSIEVNVEPGETRYVRCRIGSGFLSGRAKLEIVGPESFEPDRSEYELPGD
ncbi:DUF2846 domain-containing protein [Citromicrobium bathyomarinum]|uniref:DUF2846 domain-containing protein n=1 Tax=Citromicrobium bathyomarinum TaxID=72174 RepID=UPI00315A7CFF